MSDYLRNADAASPDVDMFGQPGTTKEQMLAVQRGKSVDGTGNARFSVNPNLLSDVARATNTDKASLGINKATAVGLEEGTVSQFKPQADGGNVMTPADLSAWSTHASLPQTGTGVNADSARFSVNPELMSFEERNAYFERLAAEEVRREDPSFTKPLTEDEWKEAEIRAQQAADAAAVEANGDGAFSVSDETKRRFAEDPSTENWTVFMEPDAVRSLPAHVLGAVDPVTDRMDNNSVEKAVMALFSEFGVVRNSRDGLDVVFSRGDAGKMMMQSGADMRTFAPYLKELFEGSVLAFSNPPINIPGHKVRRNVEEYRHYVNKFVRPEGEYFVRFTVRMMHGAHDNVHATTVSDVKIYENAAGADPANKSGGPYRVFTDRILSKFLSKGNGQTSEKSAPSGVQKMHATGSFSVTSEEDAAYMDAVKRGDMKTAERMVKPLFDAYVRNHVISEENAKALFARIAQRHDEDEEGAYAYGIRKDDRLLVPESVFPNSHQLFQDQEYDDDGNPLYPEFEYDKSLYDAGELDGTSTLGFTVYGNVDDTAEDINLRGLYANGYVYLVAGDGVGNGNDAGESLISNAKVLSVLKIVKQEGGQWWDRGKAEFTFTDKSDAPVTYDDAGNVIPLSKRFNADNPDIRFSVNGDSENVSRIVTPEEWDAAREHFGVTDNAYEAGYILPDGSMLDFSGRNEGARGGSRTIDHRDLGDVIEREGRNGAMYAALEAGAIRLYPEMPGCQIKGVPTEDALWTLREAFDQLKDRDDGIDRDFTVEFQFPYVENGEPTGLSLFRSAAYAPETDSRRIADDVRSFFQTGVVPEGTARFSVGMNYEAKLNDRMKREMVKVSNYRAVDAQASERIEQMPFVVGESASETVGYDYRTETYNDSNFQTAHANPLSKTGLEAARRYFADKGLSRFVAVVNRLKKGKGRVILKPAMRVPDEVETNSLSNTHRIVPCPALTRAFGERLAQLTGALFDTSVTSGYAGVYGADPKHLKPYLVRGIAPEENDAVVIVSGETRDELGIYAMDTDGSASAALAYVRSGVQENSIRMLAKDLVRGESGHAFLTRDTGPVHTLIKRLTPKGARLPRGIESVRGMDGFQSFLDDIALVPPTMIRKIAYADSVLQELVKWLRTDGAKNFADRLAGIKPKAESAKAPVEDSEQMDEAEELRAARDNHWIASLHDNIRDFTLNGNDELFYSATVDELIGGEERSREYFKKALAIMESGNGTICDRSQAVAAMAIKLMKDSATVHTGEYLMAKFGRSGSFAKLSERCATNVVRRMFKSVDGRKLISILDFSKPISFVYSRHEESVNAIPVLVATELANAVNEYTGKNTASTSEILETTGARITSLDSNERARLKLNYRGSVTAFDKTQCIYVDDVWSTGKSLVSLMDHTLDDENVIPVGMYTLAAGTTARLAKDIFVSSSDLLRFFQSAKISPEQIKRDFLYDVRKSTAADFRKAINGRWGDYNHYLGSRGVHGGRERYADSERGGQEDSRRIVEGAGEHSLVQEGGWLDEGSREGGRFSVAPGSLIAAKEIDIGAEPRFSILNRQIVWSELPESLSTVINSTSLAHLESADRNKPARDRFYSLMGERSTWDQEKPEAFAFARNLSTQIGTEWLGRYLLAKHFGDRRAALQVAYHFLKPAAIDLIRSARDSKRTLRIVYLQNREGRSLNKLPQAYASILAEAICEGVEIDSGIVKVSSDQNTRATQKDRVSREFVFESENGVDSSAQYLIVDDTWTSGQTTVSMLDYLRQNGADVIGITTLATGRYGKKIVPTEDQLQRALKKAKLSSLDQANQVLGFDLGKATGSELHGYILQGKQGPEGLQRWFRDVNAPLLPGILPNQGGSGEGHRGNAENSKGRSGVSNSSLPLTGTGRFSAAYPQFNGLTDDQLMALAVATDIALGKSDKVSDRSVRVSRVQKIVKQLHPEYTTQQLGVEGLRVAKDAQKLAKKIREDLDNGVSQSMIIQYLPDVYREMFGTEMREQARRGSRIGAQNTRAYMALRNRSDKLIEDAVRTQSGVETKLLEDQYGIDLSKTLLALSENPMDKPPPERHQDPTGAAIDAEDAESGEEGADVSAAIKKAVDEIVAASKASADLREKNRQNAQNARMTAWSSIR